MSLPKSTLTSMCDEVKLMGDILACYAISKEGKLLGASYGTWLPLDEKRKADFAGLASVIWGRLSASPASGGTGESCDYL
ncbi:MAG: hypothetical protein OK452_08655 [Thaumarchaeota archaeon]|nr:hypothetical protein [Nitrososphaerota archaeon]